MKDKGINLSISKSKKIKPIYALALSAAIAALYVVASTLLSFASFGPIQFRVSEILTILPVFAPIAPAAVVGLTAGCFLGNMIGLFMGANLAGVWDLLLGPAATLAAALLTYFLRGIKFKGLPVLAVIPPIAVNALVVGTELSYALFSESERFGLIWLINVLQVGLGQLVMCGIGGLILYKRLLGIKFFNE